MTDVAIIGGGISGLVTAHELARRGHGVAVLERQVRPGGSAVSERIGGFLMEHGPSSVNAAFPAATALSQTLGLEPQRLGLGPDVRRRHLVAKGALQGIPAHPLGFLTSGYLSLGARLRMAMECAVPCACDDREETVAEFWGRRFGAEFVDRVIDPLVGGLFAGTAETLSMPAVFPALLAMEREHGSITRGVLARLLAARKMPARRLFSWRDGLGVLPRVLAARLGPALKIGCTVRRIHATSTGFRIDGGRSGSFHARAVVIATQPHVGAVLLEGLDAAGSEAAAAIDAPPLAVVFLGYRRSQIAHPLDGLGYLAPRCERRTLTGAQFCSTMFAARAPEGHVALAAYIGGTRAPELGRLAPDELVRLARQEFHDLLGARGEPVLTRVRRWPLGLPQYRLGHSGRVQTLLALEERCTGLFVTGNYLSGLSVGACVTQAKDTAARVHEALLRPSRTDGSPASSTRPRRHRPLGSVGRPAVYRQYLTQPKTQPKTSREG